MVNIFCPYMNISNRYISMCNVKVMQSEQDGKIIYNIQAMALDAYVYGYPIVLMNVTEKSMIDTGLEINQFFSQGKRNFFQNIFFTFKNSVDCF